MDYYEIYKKRVNRFGEDFQSRMQNQREHNFDLQLMRSVYYITFEFEGAIHEAELTKYKQDETETLHYLLTRVDLDIPGGTVLFLPSNTDDSTTLRPWLVYYKENIKASGYNRYILLKLSHLIKWKHGDEEFEAWAYFYGQEDNMLKDEIRSRSRMDTIYGENLKTSFFITALNPNIKKDDYFEIGEGDLCEAFRVTGYDRHSTEGIEYVTVDPIYIYNKEKAPEPTAADKEEDFYWFEGGAN